MRELAVLTHSCPILAALVQRMYQFQRGIGARNWMHGIRATYLLVRVHGRQCWLLPSCNGVIVAGNFEVRLAPHSDRIVDIPDRQLR